ncbi:MFS transporter [Thermobifida halotolerans]|uniref:MFS transporter n=1 Tax=Thermobifida halotolerans TaxID=483545 RepID=A0A399G2Z3_9ACTN|nr:MFS transporter [Thermobifida halotolerans]UOE21201.1 MFS transporter [Thermobifida halotolerans]
MAEATASTTADSTTAARPRETEPSTRQRWTLFAVMAGTFIAIMDSFIVNVAIPSIRADLDASYAQIELAVAGYVLVYGLLLVTGGRLGDLFGYRRMYLAGLALFTAASLACGLAPSPELLIAARVVQAAGAALFYPQVLSVLQTAFTGKAQARAFSIFGATIGLASVAGQLVGGALVSADLFGLSWRPIFLINIPIGAATLLIAAAVLPAARGTVRPSLDLRGVALLSTALLLVSIPLVEGQAAGWPLWAWGMLALSVPCFVAFTLWERRLAAIGGDPLVPPSLFRLPGFAGGNVLALAFFAGNAGLFFVLTLHLQGGMGYSPLVAGLTFTPLAVAFVAASLLAPRIQERIGMRVLTLGYAVNAAGTLMLLGCALAFDTGLSGWIMAPALAVIGFGEGLGVSPLFGAVLANVPQRDAGAASGVLETTTQIGMSFGVTVLGLVFGVVLGAGAGLAVSTTAFTAALVGNLALAVIALALMPVVLRDQRTTTV